MDDYDHIEQTVLRCQELWEQPDLSRWVSIGFNPRLRTTLGRAFLDQRRIELNPILLGAMREHFIPTVVHELAHLVVRRRYGSRVEPHGLQFKILMAAAGMDGAATLKLTSEQREAFFNNG